MVKILGCRGSVPVSGKDFAHYGGATSCVFVRLMGQAVILDAGTGLLALEPLLEAEDLELPLLLSHPHTDHLLGLPMCPVALKPGRRFRICALPRGGQGPEEQLRCLMAPPLWPVGPELLPACFVFQPISGSFSLGSIRVDCLEGNHPGGVTLFRLTCGGKTLVYLPDCQLKGEMLARVREFARDCDLLLCDGQYSPAEWAACSSFGHSTWEMAAELGFRCGARQVRIFHHDPSHTDDVLSAAGAALAAVYPNCTFAYEGEEILL